jgi:tRNA(fMet)-specific endonuclease VapC
MLSIRKNALAICYVILSVIDRGGVNAQHLLQRLAKVDPNLVAATIFSYEEQMRGWLSYTAKARSVVGKTRPYNRPLA